MNFIDNIKQLLGIESYEQKLYKQLHTEPYTRKGYQIENLREDMSLLQQDIDGWWKPRYLMDHRSRCAYEIMNTVYDLITVTDDDIDWDSLKGLPEYILSRARMHNAMYPTLLYKYQNGECKVEWQLNPDMFYDMDEDGYGGMSRDPEIALWGTFDRKGKVIKKFTYKPK